MSRVVDVVARGNCFWIHADGVRVSYDRGAHAVYVCVLPGVETAGLRNGGLHDDLIVDYLADGRIYGYELLCDSSEFGTRVDLGKLPAQFHDLVRRVIALAPLLFPCPCCGYLVFEWPPGSYELCPICDWEDDEVQLRSVDYAGGANQPSLIDAQRSYASCGASDPRSLDRVRSPLPEEARDPGWRPASPADARAEPAQPSEETPIEPYYWRRTT